MKNPATKIQNCWAARILQTRIRQHFPPKTPAICLKHQLLASDMFLTCYWEQNLGLWYLEIIAFCFYLRFTQHPKFLGIGFVFINCCHFKAALWWIHTRVACIVSIDFEWDNVIHCWTELWVPFIAYCCVRQKLGDFQWFLLQRQSVELWPHN